jgi:HEAT repeat protein
MSHIILDEGKLRNLPFRERLDKCTSIIKNESDESLRWDAVWLAGEIAETNPNSSLFEEVAELMVWVLKNDNNGVVKHEACYQIAARNMRNKIPDLIQTALNDESIIAKHEAIESLGLMRAFDSKDMISNSLKDPNPDVRETAAFVMKRLERLQNLKGNYVPSKVI